MSKVELKVNHDLNNIDEVGKVRNWIQSLKVEDDCSSVVDVDDLESMPESSVIESSDSEFDTYDNEGSSITTTELGTKIEPTEISTIVDSLKELFNSTSCVQTVGNVNIENSTGVHIGNITNINGNIQIIHTANNRQHSFRQKKNNNQKSEERFSASRPAKGKTKASQTLSAREEPEERVCTDAFIGRIKVKLPKLSFDVLPRSSWIAQDPLEDYEHLEEPVEYVVISHTATQSSDRQAKNVGTIRDIQTFHIESRGWNDIAYNFLIGCDGNIYEGRGWGVVGAHTKGYNSFALGISFIGCFMRELPSQSALKACKELLKKGVENGHIAANYKLLCHCQISSTESPGRSLYEEIQNWDNFFKPEE